MNMDMSPNKILLTRQEVKDLLNFRSYNSLYMLEKRDKTFPPKIKIGVRRVCYKAKDVYSWLDSQKVERND